LFKKSKTKPTMARRPKRPSTAPIAALAPVERPDVEAACTTELAEVGEEPEDTVTVAMVGFVVIWIDGLAWIKCLER
jgi:hypothetical protein